MDAFTAQVARAFAWHTYGMPWLSTAAYDRLCIGARLKIGSGSYGTVVRRHVCGSDDMALIQANIADAANGDKEAAWTNERHVAVKTFKCCDDSLAMFYSTCVSEIIMLRHLNPYGVIAPRLHAVVLPNDRDSKAIIALARRGNLRCYVHACYDEVVRRFVESRDFCSTKNPRVPVSIYGDLLYGLCNSLLWLYVQWNMGARVAHLDVKPSNVLVMDDGVTLRMTDWGAAVSLDADTQRCHQDTTLVTIWYRPPELLLRRSRFDVGAVDAWSVGTTIADAWHIAMFGCGMFNADGSLDQLSDLCRTVGPMTSVSAREAGIFSGLLSRENAACDENTLRMVLESIRSVSPPLASVVRGLMRMNPEERMTAPEVKAVLDTMIAPSVVGVDADSACAALLNPSPPPFDLPALHANVPCVADIWRHTPAQPNMSLSVRYTVWCRFIDILNANDISCARVMLQCSAAVCVFDAIVYRMSLSDAVPALSASDISQLALATFMACSACLSTNDPITFPDVPRHMAATVMAFAPDLLCIAGDSPVARMNRDVNLHRIDDFDVVYEMMAFVAQVSCGMDAGHRCVESGRALASSIVAASKRVCAGIGMLPNMRAMSQAPCVLKNEPTSAAPVGGAIRRELLPDVMLQRFGRYNGSMRWFWGFAHAPSRTDPPAR